VKFDFIEESYNIFGDFKVGDNVRYNSSILKNLILANKDGIFNKMILIQSVSIIEASLGQIIYRAANFNIEGVPGVTKAEQSEISGKKVDKLNTIIQIMKKYKILDKMGNNVYEKLHEFRKYRNKVHISDKIEISDISRDEHEIFSDKITCDAVKGMGLILLFLKENYSRPDRIDGYVGDLIIPKEKP
jgi:hypothetical protein